jgi:hypothetical protein
MPKVGYKQSPEHREKRLAVYRRTCARKRLEHLEEQAAELRAELNKQKGKDDD